MAKKSLKEKLKGRRQSKNVEVRTRPISVKKDILTSKAAEPSYLNKELKQPDNYYDYEDSSNEDTHRSLLYDHMRSKHVKTKRVKPKFLKHVIEDKLRKNRNEK